MSSGTGLRSGGASITIQRTSQSLRVLSQYSRPADVPTSVRPICVEYLYGSRGVPSRCSLLDALTRRGQLRILRARHRADNHEARPLQWDTFANIYTSTSSRCSAWRSRRGLGTEQSFVFFYHCRPSCQHRDFIDGGRTAAGSVNRRGCGALSKPRRYRPVLPPVPHETTWASLDPVTGDSWRSVSTLFVRTVNRERFEQLLNVWTNFVVCSFSR